MTRCHLQASGSVELYFYGELDAEAGGAIEAHFAACAECRAALDELRTIRAALASRPDVSAPPGGDWAAFMTRLDASVRAQRSTARPAPGGVAGFVRGPRVRSWLALAALLALVTMGVLLVVSERRTAQEVPAAADADISGPGPEEEQTIDLAFATLGEQHFERSKLVVLGLATRDPQMPDGADWGYERELASALLKDTRIYRQSAEQRGLGTLAGVMRDLELVLLQASMSEQVDAESLEQLQRLIRRRDLITKMNVVRTAGLAP